MNTTQLNTTESLAEGLKHLPDIGESGISNMLRHVSHAEAAMIEAKHRLEQAIEDLAEAITTDGDGWSYMEIWQTPLRGNTTLMRKVREITKES